MTVDMIITDMMEYFIAFVDIAEPCIEQIKGDIASISPVNVL